MLQLEEKYRKDYLSLDWATAICADGNIYERGEEVMIVAPVTVVQQASQKIFYFDMHVESQQVIAGTSCGDFPLSSLCKVPDTALRPVAPGQAQIKKVQEKMELVTALALVRQLQAYTELLIAELNETVPIASVHGWKSKRYHEGKSMRAVIDSLSDLLTRDVDV